MISMSGSRMGMAVNPAGFHLANTVPPKLTAEEERRRMVMLQSVRDFEKRQLKHCETEDKAAPVVSGKVATAAGWKDASSVGSGSSALKTVPVGRGGKLKAPAGLGDLFAGGFKPNPGALRGGRGGGRGMAR